MTVSFGVSAVAVLANTSVTVCTYYGIDGIHSGAVGEEMNGFLKGEWGYQSFMMSVWGALHGSTLTAGVDHETPRWKCSWSHLLSYARTTGSTASTPAPMVKKIPGWPTTNYFNAGVSKQTNQPAVGEAATCILTSIFGSTSPVGRGICCLTVHPWSTPTLFHGSHVLFTHPAAESVVLLMNAHETLPLSATGLQTFAIIGRPRLHNLITRHFQEQSGSENYYSGGGSGHVTAFSITTPLQA